MGVDLFAPAFSGALRVLLGLGIVISVIVMILGVAGIGAVWITHGTRTHAALAMSMPSAIRR